MQVWKYTLTSLGIVTIHMPQDAKIIHAHAQAGEVCIWAEVDPERQTQARFVGVYATGQDLPGSRSYIGTVHPAGGSLVFHVYEVGR